VKNIQRRKLDPCNQEPCL